MALFIDVHNLGNPVTLADAAHAHAADLAIQGEHGVTYREYWVNEAEGKIFCLVDAPSAHAAIEVHRLAHGLVPDEIHPVTQGQ